MNAPANALISGDALKLAAGNYLGQLQSRTQGESRELLGIFDKWFIRVVTRLLSFDQAKSWEESIAYAIAAHPAQSRSLEWDFLRLRLFLDRREQGRFVSYDQREKSGGHYYPGYGTEFGSDVLLTCQGAASFMEWRGLPLMKTAFDAALYPQLLNDIRPQTIFEIGSGSGASAIWLADHLALLGIKGQVHSVDLFPVKATHPGVTFYQGDCGQPEKLFSDELLRDAPHPWLVIEDAHHNVEAVLNCFHAFMKKDDYLFVEDSEIKRAAIRGFLAAKTGIYQVDTKFTDFFGRNATCALDSIFKRVTN